MSAGRKDNGESWISQTPDTQGYFNAFVSMGTKANGKPDRRHVRRKSLAAVRRRVRELERQREAGVTRAGKALTVQQMMERHLNVTLRAKDLAPRTIDDYWSKCRNDIFPRWGGQRIDRLLPEHIEEGYAEMLEEGHAPAFVRKVHAILSSALEIQVKRGNLARNPCKQVDQPKKRENARDDFTSAQARRVLQAARGRENAARWLVGLGCGLRQGEALGLRWDYLNLETGELRAWFQLQRLTWRHGCHDPNACGKRRHKTKPCPRKCSRHTRACPPPCPPDCDGHAMHCPQRKSGGLVLREIKESRRKTVWLAAEFIALLREHRDIQYQQMLTADSEWEDTGLVFCQWNGRPIDPRADWEEWGTILTAAGLPHRRLHAMRHSAASIALDEGVALAVVQEMLGHSDIRVTRSYSHANKALAQDASARMSRALIGPQKSGSATGTATSGPGDDS